MNSFWEKLPKPFTALAPMEGVTDTVFRQVLMTLGRPTVFFTEFTSCDGLMSKLGRGAVELSLKYESKEKPIIAQLWGSDPIIFAKAAKYCEKLGFNGIDINMGCPDKAVVKKGAGGALINNPDLANEILKAVKDATKLPISVKTRIGFEDINLGWIEFLLKQKLNALTIHLRSVSELSKVDAHWELMPEIIDLRNKLNLNMLIIGNGDINSYTDIIKKYNLYHCDGFMVGRGALSNPWIFDPKINFEKITFAQKAKLYLRHIELFEKTWHEAKNPEELKQFAKTYLNNYSNARSIRDEIMQCRKISQMKQVLLKFK